MIGGRPSVNAFANMAITPLYGFELWRMPKTLKYLSEIVGRSNARKNAWQYFSPASLETPYGVIGVVGSFSPIRFLCNSSRSPARRTFKVPLTLIAFVNSGFVMETYGLT